MNDKLNFDFIFCYYPTEDTSLSILMNKLLTNSPTRILVIKKFLKRQAVQNFTVLFIIKCVRRTCGMLQTVNFIISGQTSY